MQKQTVFINISPPRSKTTTDPETGDKRQHLDTNQILCVQVPGAVRVCKLLQPPSAYYALLM